MLRARYLMAVPPDHARRARENGAGGAGGARGPEGAFAPTRFGPYTLLRSVGKGGMAEVFLARAAGLGGFERLLCVKRVLDEHASDTQLIEHLVEEAKLVSRISHANVAQVFDLGRVGEQFYIAMEWIDGVDAMKLLEACEERSIHVPIPAAAYIVAEIAKGLHAAHTTTDETGRPLGIVHRDVTPTNVLLSLEGQVKLIDFGVAKNLLRSRQTQVGVVKGKYNYLAPEQARGEAIDARADVFAAGILLYELLAGEPLYPGKKAADVLVKARGAKIPKLADARPDVPPELEAILLRALTKDRAARTQSASQLADELERYLTATAPDFGAGSLAALVAHLFPDKAMAGIESDPMSVGEFVAHKEVSLVTAPGVLVRPSSSLIGEDFDAQPTRVLTTEEVEDRRARRRAQIALTPVPPLAPRTARPAATRTARKGAGLAAVAALGVTLAGYGAYEALREPRVAIASTPPGAFIAIDGLGTGRTTPAELSLAPGTHRLELVLDGHEDHDAPLTVDGDASVSITLELARPALELDSEPTGAMVLRDGRYVGATPLVLEDLVRGEDLHLELTAAGYAPLHVVHHVTSGRTERVSLRLQPGP
jgi:serine/threonine protein kinase